MPVLRSRGGHGDRYFLYETALKSSLSKHASSPSCAHTLSSHPQFYLYHPGETSGGMALHHTEDEENSGDAPDLLALRMGTAVLLSTVTESWRWKGLHWVWTGVFLKSFFFLKKYLWQEIRLDIPEASKSLWTHRPILAGHVNAVNFLKEDPNTSFLYI